MEMITGTSYYLRQEDDYPEFPVINLYAENPPSETSTSLTSRKGLTTLAGPFGAGPIKQIFQQEGVLNGERFIISGSEVFRGNISLGFIDGDGPASIAGFEDFIFFCAGKSLWGYDGVTLQTIVFPDDADVSKICVGAQRLIALRKNTQQFYWSDILSSTIDALSFASAENLTDFLVDLLFVGDTLILGGSSTVEFWSISDDPDLPFTPVRGRTLPVGVRNTGAVADLRSSIGWVTDKNLVCIDTPENVVSYPGLQNSLSRSSSVSCWSFDINGTVCLAITEDSATWVYHTKSGLWSQFTSVGETGWIARCSTNDIFGSSVDGSLYVWDESYYELGLELERRFRAWSPLVVGTIIIHNIILRTNTGQTPDLASLFASPSVEMRMSKNGGQTWTSWRKRSMGRAGVYRLWTKWNANGAFGQPGVLLEFRITDPIPFRTAGVYINEAVGGL